MKYLGSKQRISKQLVAFLQPYITNTYVEPFVGSAAVMSRIRAQTRIASDSNTALINMWTALSNGWIPPTEVSEEEYNQVKSIQDPNDPITAFAGFGLSFSGKYFGGYARDNTGRNYAKNAASSLQKKMKGLDKVQWLSCDYRECPIPPNSVIYCDPPYQHTTQYKAVAPFNHDEFWNWCTLQATKGHTIFISEYKAPSNFKEVWNITTHTDIRTKKGKEERIERLFTPKCV